MTAFGTSYAARDSQHPIRTAATKRRQLTTGRTPLVTAVRANCEFALRKSGSFGSSEPKH